MSKTALLFPGQGSQYIGMGKRLCEMFPIAAETFEEAGEALGFDLKDICFTGSSDKLMLTENAQPAILTASVAAFRVYRQEIGVVPEFTAGHSLGEITALCCAGAVKFGDAVRLVRLRGRLMQEAAAPGIGGMAAVNGADRAELEKECAQTCREGQVVVISNYNAPDQLVISGHGAAVAAVSAKLSGRGARIIPLRVSAPFHSPLMQAAADRFKEELARCAFADLQWPVLANITALPYPGCAKICEYLTRQIVEPVRWQASMAYLQERGVQIAIEVGPQSVLKNLWKNNCPGLAVLSLDEKEDFSAAKRHFSAGKRTIEERSNGLALLTKCIAAAVSTKNRNWNEEEYQAGVVRLYRKMAELKNALEKKGIEPSGEQLRDTLTDLEKILETKGLPAEERLEILEKIVQDGH